MRPGSWKRRLLPVAAALVVAWWLRSFQAPLTTLEVPGIKGVDTWTSLVISPKGRFLLSLNHATFFVGTQPERTFQFWDLDRNELCCSHVIGDNDNWWAGVFSPDERSFAVPTKNGSVRLWNPQTGQAQGEYALATKGNAWYPALAYTQAGRLIGFRADESEETTVYEIESSRILYRLPRGHVTPLMSDIAIHSSQGHLRLFRLDDGLDLSKPFLQNRFEVVTLDKNGDLESSFHMGHEFRGCTLDGTVLFGTYRFGGMTSSTHNFLRDYKRDTFEDVDANWGGHDQFLRPSWTGRYVVRTEENLLPEWLTRWIPLTSSKSLVLRDYESRQVLLTIPDGLTAEFSQDDRVMATCVGQGRIHIWDLPPRRPWLSMAAGGVAAWTGVFLFFHWVRRIKIGDPKIPT